MLVGDLADGGNKEALERALESCRTYLLCVAWNHKGPDAVLGAEGASDLVQETMLVALRKLQAGKEVGSTERDQRAWLRQILINLMHEKTRRMRRQPGQLHDDFPDPATFLNEAEVWEDEMRAMNAALAQLREDERELVTWRCGDGLSYQEIGRRRKCSDVYARRLVIRILERLRTMYLTGVDHGT